MFLITHERFQSVLWFGYVHRHTGRTSFGEGGGGGAEVFCPRPEKLAQRGGGGGGLVSLFVFYRAEKGSSMTIYQPQKILCNTRSKRLEKEKKDCPKTKCFCPNTNCFCPNIAGWKILGEPPPPSPHIVRLWLWCMVIVYTYGYIQNGRVIVYIVTSRVSDRSVYIYHW